MTKLEKITLATFVILGLLSAMACTPVSAQVKIGNIAIDNETAQRYFLDCYNRPDTIPTKNSTDFSCTNCSMPIAEFDRAQTQANDYNANLIRSSLGKGFRTVYYKAHKDTSYEWHAFSGSQMPNKGKSHGKITKIEDIPAGSYQEERGYLVPRKPTETDFIKWKTQIDKQ